MSYIVNSDIELRLGTARYIQLTDDAGTGSADTAVVDEARLGAEGEVNSYLSQRYAVPVDLATHTEAAGVVKSVSLDLSEFRLHMRRRDVPAYISAKREAAIAWLKSVADGSVALPSVAVIESGSPGGPRSSVTGETRVMTRDSLGGF